MAEHATTDPGDEEDAAHDAGAHGDDNGHGAHGLESDAVGPVDRERWGSFALGIGLGLIVALCIVVATGGSSA